MGEGDDVPSDPGVRPLGAYAARSCPVATQWDVLRPVEPAPAPAFLAALGQAGEAFEAEVFGSLLGLYPDAQRVEGSLPAAEREARTVAAMDRGVALILGARLPVDRSGMRVAQPDILVRDGASPSSGRWRYLAVDVKHHRVVVEVGGGAAAVVQSLEQLAPPDEALATGIGRRDSTAKRDLLQLAHYQRTLEGCDRATRGSPWAGVLGREGVVAWYRLDEPMWQHTDRHGTTFPQASSLEAYDREFADRLDIAVAAARHVSDPTSPLPVQPIRITECPNCRWRAHCDRLLAERQDASLLPAVRLDVWRTLHAVGLDTMPALLTADPADPPSGLTSEAFQRIRDEAAAYTGDAPIYRQRHVSRLRIPRAQVEVDVDMENVEGGAYLWGTFTTDRTGAGLVAAGYRSFVDWSADPAVAGAAAFASFWAWLRDLRGRCADTGVSFAAYCWSQAAENTWLRVGGADLGIEGEVEAFIDSPAWIDLLPIVRSQVITGFGFGLKLVAPLTGFHWRDDDPGGAQSMQWWHHAVDPTASPAVRDRQRARLLAYNQDDVAATAHLRGWLDDRRDQLPSIQDRDGTILDEVDPATDAAADV